MHHPKRRKKSFGALGRILLACLALAAGMFLALWLDLRSSDNTSAAADRPLPAPAGPGLEDLAAGSLAVVDLSWPLNHESAYWPGDNYKPFELHAIATLEKDGVSSKAFSSPEHLGTHLDAPSHFERDHASIDQLGAAQLFAPGVVIDVSGKASADADYLISPGDVHDWEAEHGMIPQGALVLVYTGWSRFWNNAARYQGRDVMGKLHFPGFSSEAVEFLIARRDIRGVGLDTMSVDPGLSRDFPVHHVLGKADRYGLENLANLDKLPAKGFYLFVAPMKIEGGTGGPTRVFAILAKAANGN